MSKKVNGRPTIYTDKLGTKICSLIASGKSVRKIVKDPKMPSSSTIFRWLLDTRYKSFWEQYEKARNVQAELMFEELIEIADTKDKDVMRDRLRVDTRKWYLSKIVPKKYGDKIDHTTDGKPINFIVPKEIADKNNIGNDTSFSTEQDSEEQEEV